MPRIRSANPDFEYDQYPHGVDQTFMSPAGTLSRKTGIPMAFQVTSPLDPRLVLLPHALVLHVNPANFTENFNKKVERIQTRGGFVEQHWGDELGEISGDGSTGAFLNIQTGLSSVLRHQTIAWDRYRDLYDLYRNNGSVHDPFGNIVLQGSVMLMYDRGTYLGTFRNFSVEETDDAPFRFGLNWTFKVEKTLHQIPVDQTGRRPVAPSFQAQNKQQSSFQASNQSTILGQVSTAKDLQDKADAMNANLSASAAAQSSGQIAANNAFSNIGSTTTIPTNTGGQ